MADDRKSSNKTTMGRESTIVPVSSGASDPAARASAASRNAGGGTFNGVATTRLTEHNIRAHNRIMNDTTGDTGNTPYSVQRWLSGTDDTLTRPTEAPGWTELVARDEIAAQIDAAVKHAEKKN